jgi:hypothetical protein
VAVELARLCATDEDVVDGNVNCEHSLLAPLLLCFLALSGYEVEPHTQLNNVTDNTHDEETDTDGLADLEEFALVGLTV